MKILNIFFISLFFTMNSMAQKKLGVSQDSTLSVKVYAGIYTGTYFSLDSLTTQSEATVRIGAALDYKVSPKITFEGFGVYQRSRDKDLILTTFGFKYDLNRSSFLKVGKIPTPTTLFRPYPLSGVAQFESWTTSNLPGASLGAMAKWDNSHVGLYSRNKDLELHISQKILTFKIGAWWNKNEHGFVVSYNKSKISSTSFYKYNDEQTIGNLFVYSLNSKWILYSDMGYNLNTKKLPRFNTGVLRVVNLESYKDIKGLLGFAWDYKTNSFVGYLQITL